MSADEAERGYETLTDDELLRLLETEEDRLPRDAVDEFVRRAERMVEPLTAICRDEAAWQKDGATLWAAIHAPCILAAIGGERVLCGLLAALPHAQRRHIEWVTEELPPMFGAVGPAAADGLMALVADEKQPSMVRWLAATCLGGVAVRHEAERDRVLDFLRDVAGRGDDYEVRGGAGLVLLDFLRPDDRETLQSLGKEIEEGAGPMPLFAAGDVDEAYETGRTGHEHYVGDWLSLYDPAAIADRQARWKREDAAQAARERQAAGRDTSGLLLKTQPGPSSGTRAAHQQGEGHGLRGTSPTTVLPARLKTGRNDPCPCGSGKKYKRCCGR